jgi:hypothetical protein
MQTTATQAHAAIQHHAETQASPEVRHVERADTAVRQGDVYLRPYRGKPLTYHYARGEVSIERATATEEIQDRQLAPGTTQGSRHIVEGQSVRLYRHARQDHPLIGPVLVVTDRCTITHPEHAHISLPPGEWQVTYQDDLMQEEIARVRD